VAPLVGHGHDEWDSVDTSSTSALFGTTTPGFSSVFQQLPLANLFIRDASSRCGPRSRTTHATIASFQRPASTCRRPRRSLPRLRKRVQLPPHSVYGPLLLSTRRRHRAAGIRIRPQAEHRARANHEPGPQGVPSSSGIFSRHPGRARLFLRSIGPAVAAHFDPRSQLRPNCQRANIGGNLEAYGTSSSSFRSSTRSASAASSSSMPATPGIRRPVCRTTRPRSLTRSVQPCFNFPGSVGYLRTSDRLRDSLVLASRPAPLRMGLPPGSLPTKTQRFRVHDRQFSEGSLSTERR